MSIRPEIASFDLQVMALLLRQTGRLQVLSGGMLALVGLWLVLGAAGVGNLPVLSLWLLLASGAAGLGQGYYAARTDLDAALLRLVDATDAPSAAHQLDATLLALELMPPARAGRDWRQRWQGMRRLAGFQAASLVLQALLLAAAGLAACLYGGA